MVLSYSNALTECRDRRGQMLGIEGVLQRMEKLNPRRPEQKVGALIKDIQSEDRGNLQSCDATVLLCCATNTGVAWKDNLPAPIRIFGSATDNTRIS